jgi:hypothetical protein
LLWLRLNIVIGDLKLSKIMASVFIFTLASLASGIVIQITKLAIWPFIDMSTFIGVFIQLSVCAIMGLLTYGFICYFLKNQEILEFLKILKRRLPWKKTRALDSGEARGL